jgi:hypothetical protein
MYKTICEHLGRRVSGGRRDVSRMLDVDVETFFVLIPIIIFVTFLNYPHQYLSQRLVDKLVATSVGIQQEPSRTSLCTHVRGLRARRHGDGGRKRL